MSGPDASVCAMTDHDLQGKLDAEEGEPAPLIS
jgi:hypothetical protein